MICTCQKVGRREGVYHEWESLRLHCTLQLLTDSHLNPPLPPPHVQCCNPIREGNLECLFGNLHSFIIFFPLLRCWQISWGFGKLNGLNMKSLKAKFRKSDVSTLWLMVWPLHHAPQAYRDSPAPALIRLWVNKLQIPEGTSSTWCLWMSAL